MLEIQHLSKTFHRGTPNEVKALKRLNLSMSSGEFVCVIGTNGSGKSSLLNAVAGSFFPDSGSIVLDGRDISRWPEYKRAGLIGRVFQNPFTGTAAGMSIMENMSLAMKRGLARPLRKAIGSALRKQVSEKVAALHMGLESRLDNPIGSLSGGQRQALTLLMATYLRPKLLLLDEHTAALDPKSATKIASLTREIIRREKLSALMVTHSMAQAVELPDRIIMMHKGEIIRDIKAEERKRIRIADLHQIFDRIQKRELLNSQVSSLLMAQYR